MSKELKEFKDLNTQEKFEKIHSINKKIDDNISKYFRFYYTIKTIQIAADYADNYTWGNKIYEDTDNNDTYIHAIAEALEFVCQHMIDEICELDQDIDDLEFMIRNVINTI